MSRALQQAAGERMRGFLRRITRTPLTGALAGLLVTAVLQSSSATTVMVIGFVSAGLMELPQAVAVVFGANVGTTMTAQLVAFRLADWVFPILFAGVLVWLLARREQTRQLGLAVFSFGLLFDGIEVLSGAMTPLAEHPVFLRWMTQVRHTPLLGLLLGTGMTLVVQSSSAVTVLVVVLAVLLNLIVRAVPTKYTEFDLSEAGLYTLSDSSKDIAHALTQDVTIYYLAETGSEDAIITKLLDRYASESSHIKWETKDPAVYPTFAAQYGVQSAENGSLILVSGEKSAVLAASDLYDYDYSDYYTTGSYSVTFGGENKLTAAIYLITSGEELHAYYTTNHGEQRLTDTLTDALEGQNLSVSPLDLLTDTIPDDCDLLIINDPQQDFASTGGLVDEMSALRAYLKNGGHLMLTTDSYYSTPNLDALMAEFGLTRTTGLVVEGDSGHYLNGYPYYLLPDYATDTESGTLDGIDTSRRVLLQMAQGITITETEGIASEALLVSTESSYSKAAGYEMTTAETEAGDKEQVPDGPFALAAYASNNSTGAEVIWVNCGNMDNEAVYQTVPGNGPFLQGCAASLAGQEGTTLVESKALEAAPITISGHTAAVLGLVFVLILPAAVLAVGAVVVLLRRRK